MTNIPLYHQLSGRDDDAPVVVLSHSLMSDMQMWNPQLELLEQHFQVLRFDTRGHGQSSVTEGEYTLEQLANDAVGLLDSLLIDQVHWVGLSMGGMIGQSVALRYPSRLLSLSLCDTMAQVPSEAQPIWRERIQLAQDSGIQALTDGTLERWFTDDFRNRGSQNYQAIRQQILATDVDGFTGCSAAIMRLDYIEQLPQLNLPVQIIVGDDDLSTPVENSIASGGDR